MEWIKKYNLCLQYIVKWKYSVKYKYLKIVPKYITWVNDIVVYMQYKFMSSQSTCALRHWSYT